MSSFFVSSLLLLHSAERSRFITERRFYHRGQVYFITGDYPLAIAEYEQSSILDPVFVFSHIQLAVAQYKKGDINRALTSFEALVKERPQSGEVVNYYGELLLDQGQYEKAVSMFERSILLNKDA
jgi:import receptor subunit TOM70